MIPIIAGIVSTLIQNNLPKVAQAVTDKGIEYVQDKLGLELKPDMNEAEIAAVKEAAMKHEEFMVAAANANTANARDMNARIQESLNSAWLAKNSAYLLDFIIVSATMFLSWFAFVKKIPLENKELVYMTLGSLYTMCGTVINFHRGSSSGSKAKQEALEGKK